MAEIARVRVVLVDSGVDPRHPGLTGRWVLAGPAFRADGTQEADGGLRDDDGHGTWMAAAILDLAPEVEIVSLRVLGADATGDVASLIAGLRTATALSPDLINCSVGTTSLDHRDELAAVVDQAIAKGIRIVAPASLSGLPSFPGAFPGVDGVLADADVPRQMPARRPHGERQVWFASPFPPPVGAAVAPPRARGESLATANVTGFLARLRRR